MLKTAPAGLGPHSVMCPARGTTNGDVPYPFFSANPPLKKPANGRTLAVEVTMPNAASKTTGSRTRAERLETRVTAEQKNLIERAAALQGRSVTDFVLSSVQDAARRAIEEHSQLALSVRDSEAFVDALINPRPVNDRLRDTVRRYRERTGV
ncbi:type II toxin-antitoxin system TacA family antitoxin [Acidomonas methanolica]|uniref:type II toxin-antitoxin system TacA family antitoxin n=1 Tax=Acidomonas methanolica TaxID=437 RepID=UPI00211A60DB|nr:DUF1778 domain-containing protein [Acidomonas methanolica]